MTPRKLRLARPGEDGVTIWDAVNQMQRHIVMSNEAKMRAAEAAGDDTEAAIHKAYLRSAQGNPSQPVLVELVRMLQSEDFSAKTNTLSVLQENTGLRNDDDTRQYFGKLCVKEALDGNARFFELLAEAIKTSLDFSPRYPNQLHVVIVFDALRKELLRVPTAKEILHRLSRDRPNFRIEERTVRYLCKELRLPLSRGHRGRPKKKEK